LKKAIAVFGALALGLVAAACAQNSGSSNLPAQEAETTEQNSIEVTMQDYAFAIEGEPTAGEVMVNFNNIGEEIHHAIVGKLDEGKTLDDVLKIAEKDPNSPPPPWFDDSPLDMAVLSPSQTTGLAIDAEEGTYVLLCFMPDPKGQPHIAHGMAQTFEVGPSDEPVELEVDEELSMTEEGVDLEELTGPSLVSVTNDMDKPGEFVIAQLAEGKTLDDIDPWFGQGQPDPAPVTFYGGTHAFEPGESAIVNLDLEPGDYQFLTTFEDGKKRKDVTTEFTVTE
jgi:hypothetical protein